MATAAIAPILELENIDPERLSGAGLRTFLNISSAWGLANDEMRALLGSPSESTFYQYKAGKCGTLSHDTLTRISLVIGIYKALHILYPDETLADSWVRLPNRNPIFGGRPALELMVNAGLDGLFQVRRLLDGRRGA
ncbi:MAG: MbcA/ParS/Xre antitoxin family protein [Bryobacteraceae bacterium]|nr:MbcA/ParS/Xre antitoxin family protein [Bryobacteraceae bacterium]